MSALMPPQEGVVGMHGYYGPISHNWLPSTDITGATGLAIIRAIVAGERDPVHLARFRAPRCASSTEEIEGVDGA
jgi:hypothetical protein